MEETAKPFKWVGTRPIRPDGVEKVTGRARYGADYKLPGMIHGRILRSPHAHARIRGIDTSKAAANHLVRELAIELAPTVRVNAVAPATVVQGSSMFPRDRIIGSLAKYGIKYTEKESDDSLRSKLAKFYASRTLTNDPITPEDQAKIFDKFTQLDATETKQHEGTGLGLTISKELAHLLQGEITIDSVVGEGATFSLVVPVKPVPPSAPLMPEVLDGGVGMG